MNCTTLISASASHFRCAEATIRKSFRLLMLANLQKSLAVPQVRPTVLQADALHCAAMKRCYDATARCRMRSTSSRRWALLIMSELMNGPLRYSDLAETLGVGTNILAARLRELENAGVIQKRRLPPPAASQVYELTEYGAQLKPVLHELAPRAHARSIAGPRGRPLLRLARERGPHRPRGAAGQAGASSSASATRSSRSRRAWSRRGASTTRTWSSRVSRTGSSTSSSTATPRA